MVKADIVGRVSERIGCSKKEAFDYVETVFSIVKDTLEAGEKVKIAGFGNFTVKQKADRKGRNPQTGETITIDARRVLTFKPSNVLRASVNQDQIT